MLTDDPGTPGNGRLEINTAYLEHRSGQDRVRSFPHVDFNYGLGDHIQLKYETGWIFAASPDGREARNGLDNSLFGLKWRFLDQETSGVDMSTYPQLHLENNNRSAARGVANPGPNLFLPVSIARRFGRTAVLVEVGYQYSRILPDEWVFGLLGAFYWLEDLELLAEVRRFSETLHSRADVVANVGLRRALGPGFRLLASIGTGVSNGPEVTRFIAYLGIQMMLGDKPEP